MVIFHNPYCPVENFQLGWLSLQDRLIDNDLAIDAYSQAIALDPNDAVAFNNRGVAYNNQSEFEDAIVDFNQAIALDPDDAIAYGNRGFALVGQGNYEKAIADLNQAIALDPNYIEAYNNRGRAYDYQGDHEAALADYNQAIELDPTYAAPYNNICWYGSLSGRAAEVLDICEQAVLLASERHLAIIRDSRGLARALNGDYSGAIEDFKYYIEWTKENGQYETYGAKRDAWIAELEAGQNPFNEEVLKALRTE